jgi:hypothetical protein
VDYLQRLRQERPALYWLVLLVAFWLGFQVLLVVARFVLGPFVLPAWAPLALVLAVLVLVARRQGSR